jgi:hypothetical protein
MKLDSFHRIISSWDVFSPIHMYCILSKRRLLELFGLVHGSVVHVVFKSVFRKWNWPNFREQYIFQGLNLHLVQKKGKFIESISDFQGESLGNTDYDLQCLALSFFGYRPDTSLKIKLLTTSGGIRPSIYDLHVSKSHYCCRRCFITTLWDRKWT